jgi:hypothetical protein
MELRQEIEAFYIIPAVRRELARRLAELGLTQREVARKLGVTDAAVSQYLSNKRGTSFKYEGKAADALSRSANKIKSVQDDKVVRAEIDALCELLKSEKVICEIHRKHTTVKEGCSTCFDK